MFKWKQMDSSAFCKLFYNQPETAVYRGLSLCELRSLITPSQVSCVSWHVPPVATALPPGQQIVFCFWHKHEPLLLTGAHSMKAVATLPFGQPFRLSLDETRLEVPMSHFCALFPSLVVKVGFGWCVSSFHLFLNLACAKWCQMVPNGAKWCQMVPNGDISISIYM